MCAGSTMAMVSEVCGFCVTHPYDLTLVRRDMGGATTGNQNKHVDNRKKTRTKTNKIKNKKRKREEYFKQNVSICVEVLLNIP